MKATLWIFEARSDPAPEMLSVYKVSSDVGLRLELLSQAPGSENPTGVNRERANVCRIQHQIFLFCETPLYGSWEWAWSNTERSSFMKFLRGCPVSPLPMNWLLWRHAYVSARARHAVSMRICISSREHLEHPVDFDHTLF